MFFYHQRDYWNAKLFIIDQLNDRDIRVEINLCYKEHLVNHSADDRCRFCGYWRTACLSPLSESDELEMYASPDEISGLRNAPSETKSW